MKRKKGKMPLLAVFLSVVIAFSLLNTTTPVKATGVAVFTFETVTGKSGEEVVVPLTLQNNPGIATFRFRLAFDTDRLTFLSAEKGEALIAGTLNYTSDAESKTSTFLWYSDTNLSGDGEMVKLHFRITDGAVGPMPLQVTYLPQDVLNENVERVPYEVIEGTILTGSKVYGTIRSFGNELEPVVVKLIQNDVEIRTFSVSGGQYELESIPEGTYQISLAKSAHAPAIYDLMVGAEDLEKNLAIFLAGDLNEDGLIDINDAIYVLYYTFFQDDYPLNQNADFTGDGEIDINDAIYILYYTFFPDDYPIQ